MCKHTQAIGILNYFADHSVSEIMQWKEAGNNAYKENNSTTAVDYYSQAITYLVSRGGFIKGQSLSQREVAVLYGNRAEAYIKLGKFQEAFADARKCVESDNKWFKVGNLTNSVENISCL